MVGFYADSPSWRIAYDEDGTRGVIVNPSLVITDLVSADLVKLNDESNTTGVPLGDTTSYYLALLFPCLMDIDACFAVMDTISRPSAIQTSVNTTNGVDGTWVTQSVGSAPGNILKPNMRNDIVSGTWGGIRGVRFYCVASGTTRSITSIHLYGEPTAGQTLDRLVLWHPTLNQRVSAAYFDYGDTPRGSSADKTFRVKNLSPTLTATAPRISLEALTDGSPSVPGFHTLSKGSGFASQQNLANIAPGGISAETCTLRRTTPTNAQLGLWDLRIQAEATTWV